MAPHRTRSATKSSPGRTTRNSIFGRPPPSSPLKPRRQPAKSPVRPAPARSTETKAQPVTKASGTKGTSLLEFTDDHGVRTSVAPSDTGEGVHIRWHYPEDACEVKEEECADVDMAVNEARDITPPITHPGTGSIVRPSLPQTPLAPQPYEAGSVIETPVKSKLLQRTTRIGDKGICCVYDKDGIFKESNGPTRIVFHHPVGSSANLTRAQVEQLENEQEQKIIRYQVEKLFAQKWRLEEEEKRFCDSGYEDDMETDASSTQGSFKREGTGDTIPISDNELPDAASSVEPKTKLDRVSVFLRGPNGELLDSRGRQMLGREGTIMVFPTNVSQDALVVPTEDVDKLISGRLASTAKESGRKRLGPEGTEIIF